MSGNADPCAPVGNTAHYYCPPNSLLAFHTAAAGGVASAGRSSLYMGVVSMGEQGLDQQAGEC